VVKTAIHIGVFDDSNIWMCEVKKLGYRIIATHPMDIKHKHYYDKVAPYIDVFYKVDYMDTDKLISIAKEHSVELNIIHPCTNDASYAIGVVNSALGLKGITKSVAEKVASKISWHNFLVEHNFPRAGWCYRYNDIADPNMLEYPCVVKPNYGAGSQGVKKIYSANELVEFMTTKEYANGYYLTKNYDYYLVQEYTQARWLLGLNAAVENSNLIIFAHYVRDLHSVCEQLRLPYFYYEESLYPTENVDFLNEKNIQCINDLVKTLKVDNTALRFDIFLDEKKDIVSFVELNLRPGSSNSAGAFNEIYGYNITEQLIKLNTYEPVKFERQYDTKYKFMYCKNFRFNPGKVRSIKWPELNEHVYYFSSRLEPGSNIPPVWNVATAGLCGELLLLGETPKELFQLLDEFTRAIEIEYY